MISFIIPTIYKSPRLIQLLYDLNSCSYVSEILVIEDSPSNGMLSNISLDKVKVIPFTEKRYCNGAWNYGISPNNALTGRIPIIQLYNRALTPSEILQNYNSTKGRFGL